MTYGTLMHELFCNITYILGCKREPHDFWYLFALTDINLVHFKSKQ